MNKPIKPNIAIPEEFAANGTKADFDDNKIQNGFDRLKPDVLAGDNLNKFIDDTYKGLNYAMAGADAINLIKEGEVLTVKDGQLVSGSSGGGQIIGQTIFSLDPLYEAGIHLFDGALIEKTGIYKDFYNTYLTKLKASHPERFITEEAWQESVSQYGVCGKYVDGVDTFRLPKVTGIVEGTLDVRALGDVIEAGLPNITGGIDSPSKWLKLSIPATKVTGAIKIENSGAGGAQTGNTNGYGKLTFNASDSNPIYGASDTVQPQTTKGYLYLVMANSTKTQIEVDIDNVVTDLNGKLNTDCSNATPKLADSFIDKLMPDLTSGISINTPFVAPSDGILILMYKGKADSRDLRINNVIVDAFYIGQQGYYDGVLKSTISKGQTAKFSKTGEASTYTFYPLKGAN